MREKIIHKTEFIETSDGLSQNLSKTETFGTAQEKMHSNKYVLFNFFV